MSIFSSTPLAPPDPILSLITLFKEDTDPHKVNLGVGAYRTEDSKPYVLPVVRRVEAELSSNPDSNHEYLPQQGLATFSELSAKLILGNGAKSIEEGRVVTVQTLSGTGALRVAFAFVARYMGAKQVYVSKQTWSNHRNVVTHAGLPPSKDYRYLNDTNGVDISAMLADLSAAEEGSIVVLHGCAHNPSGADPTQDEWKQILEVVQQRKLIPFFDVAYQGFASGSLEDDAWSVRLFEQAGMEMFVSQSYAKNMGLYGERIGALNFVMNDAQYVDAVKSQLKLVIRAMYSNPPLHGALVASRILGDAKLMEEWQGELRMMSGRILKMREMLRSALIENETPGNWDHIVKQIGMFSYTGLSSQQVKFLTEKYHIYLTSNGRISMAGLNEKNVHYVANAMKDAVLSVKA